MPTRRESIQLLGAAAIAAATPGYVVGKADSAQPPRLAPERAWLAKLGQSLPLEVDYTPEIEGRLPVGLSGTLYRNGPGLFDRDGFRKWTILDGDGLVRATSFLNGQVRFRTRFVQTSKYAAEQGRGEFLYPTWTTPAPEFLRNIPCIPTHSQAGVTPVIKDGVLYAFDELGAPYGLDPTSLTTQRPIDPYEGPPDTGPLHYKAHTKTDGHSGDWVLVGQRGRVHPELHVVVKSPAGRQTRHVVLPNPRGAAYFHDFFWADPYVVFHLQPALLSPLPMLAGLRPFADSLQWRPEQGSLLFVVDTSGKRAPVRAEIPACWMWHALNAHSVGDTIVADFVGYDGPDHFLGPRASFRAIMRGRDGTATSPGTLRRVVIDLQNKSAQVQTVADGRYEFPTIPLQRTGLPYRYGYVAAHSSSVGWFHDGLARIDVETGAQTVFYFGSDHYVGEPVFVPDPAVPPDPADPRDRGWLLAEVLEGPSEKSFIAVFEAAHLDAGPIAKVRLRHHLPFSFHGWWAAA